MEKTHIRSLEDLCRFLAEDEDHDSDRVMIYLANNYIFEPNNRPIKAACRVYTRNKLYQHAIDLFASAGMQREAILVTNRYSELLGEKQDTILGNEANPNHPITGFDVNDAIRASVISLEGLCTHLVLKEDDLSDRMLRYLAEHCHFGPDNKPIIAAYDLYVRRGQGQAARELYESAGISEQIA